MYFRVGAWTVQPDTNTLVRARQARHITPKSMDRLTCFVADDALTHCIGELRQAFRDPARDPEIIEPIARRGYRVLPPVLWEDSSPHPPVVDTARVQQPSAPANPEGLWDPLRSDPRFQDLLRRMKLRD